MITFTKEQLIARINQVTAINKYRISRDPDADGLAMDNELLAIALASLEAESVACPKCNDTGMADSGGVQPWGEPISVPCDCTAQPALAVDADDNFYSWFGREWHDHYQQNQYTTAAKQMLGVMAESAWKAGRCAAMLQGAEHVTKQCRLPEDFDFDHFNDPVWFEAIIGLDNMYDPVTRTLATVALELNRKLDKPELTVWYGAIPESNGKTNWTAILHRKGEGRCMDGFTIDRSEYPGRVLYAADRVRYLIGEKSERPSILDYDADAHSGYVRPGNSPVIPEGWVACSERMPDGMQTVITSNGFDIGQGWWDGEGWNSFDSHDVVPGEVTHWMPLPAAPKQEA